MLKEPAVAAGFFMPVANWLAHRIPVWALASVFMPTAQQWRQFGQAANLGIRALFTFPRLACRVEPHRTQARLLRPGDVITRVVAHVHRLAGVHATALQRFLKQSRIRLGDADIFGAQGKVKVVRQAHALHISIAIGDHPQQKVLAQGLQHRLGFREYAELVACVDECLEAHIGHFRGLGLWITGLFKGVHQHPVAQDADAVFQLGMTLQHVLAQLGEMLQGQVADLGGVHRQPFAHRRLGADDDGYVVP